jgi:hypothetical protein
VRLFANEWFGVGSPRKVRKPRAATISWIWGVCVLFTMETSGSEVQLVDASGLPADSPVRSNMAVNVAMAVAQVRLKTLISAVQTLERLKLSETYIIYAKRRVDDFQRSHAHLLITEDL